MVGSGKSASFRIVFYDSDRVNLPQPDSIAFADEMALEEGTYRQASFVTEPYPSVLNKFNDLVFEVDNEEIAGVSELGVVTGKRPGTTSMVVRRYNPETYEMEVVGTVTVTVTERTPDPTPEPAPKPTPEPEPEPASETEPTPDTNPTPREKLPKTADETAPFVMVACLAVAGGICLLTARRLRT